MKFKSRIRSIGNSHAITVPAQYLKDGYLKVDQVYEVVLREVDDA